ncbi:hypothetical protein RRG08_000596 [Elysia crispata]|uniref:Cytochrome P450 n=1 Tax=Elysia crispata TaxID=231223 RepID=A0AAE0Y8D2_9GAST|nr:hypothetical protein RRG08_000596 [Elysia crispata]
MGNKDMVYLNTLELVEKYLEGCNGEQFLDRPTGPAAFAEGLIFGSGDKWKNNKKAFLKAMHTQTLLEDMEAAVQIELNIALDDLYQKAETGEPTKIGDTLLPACANVVSSFLLGESLPKASEDRTILHGIVKNLENVDLTSPLVQFSLKHPKLCWYLKKILWQDIVDIHATSGRLQRLIGGWINQIRQKSVDPTENQAQLIAPDSSSVDNVTPQVSKPVSDGCVTTEEYFQRHLGHEQSMNVNHYSILRRILAQPEFRQTEGSKDEELLQSLVDMFFGGVTTVLSGLEFILMYLSKNPTMQKLAQQEIAHVLVKETKNSSSKGNQAQNEITWSMREKMPYLRACIVEGLRLGCVTPSSVPHVASVDAEIEGYSVPRGTLVFVSLYSVHRDQEEYAEPTEFRPERHLDSEGNFRPPKNYRPYGIGARLCLGEALSEMEIFIFVAVILKEFTIVPPESKKASEMKTHMRIVHRLKDFECILSASGMEDEA